MLRYLSGLLILLFLNSSCSDSGSGERNTSMLPEAMGARGELFVVMDSTSWHGELGETLRDVFAKEIQTLPREEYLFTIRHVRPEKMTKSLRTVTNLIYVATLDSRTGGSRLVKEMFSQESIEKIKSSNEFFISSKEDLFARGQTVMYLFGNNEAELIKNIEENEDRLVGLLERKNREQLADKLFKRRSTGIEKSIAEKFNIDIKIPYGYQIALINEEFIWIRQMDIEIDKNIFIYQTPYYDLSQFENFKAIERRNTAGKKYIYEDKEMYPDSYLVTETEIPFKPVISRQTNVNGKYAVETRGLWRTNNKSMGGPFIGISTVNEATNKIIYVEGFIFSPGKAQRETVKEMETVIYSLKTPEQVRKNQQ